MKDNLISFVLSLLSIGLVVIIIIQMTQLPNFERNKISSFRSPKVVMGFTADWCGPCDTFFNKYPDIDLINVDESPAATQRAMLYGVRQVPALLISTQDSLIVKYE